MWQQLMKRAAISGTVASIASTLALGVRGRAEQSDASGPVNGPSQWIWGRGAARRRGVGRHTLVGYLIHHAMSVLWGTVFESFHTRRTSGVRHVVLRAMAITAIAYIVDFKVVPKRFSPGFEKQLSRSSLTQIYGAFALGLVASALLRRR